METLEKAPAKLNLSLDALFRHLDGDPEWRILVLMPFSGILTAILNGAWS